MRYFEDFAVGQVVELGTVSPTEEQIVAFARQYDPQPFHVDPQAATSSVYGGLIASGWHTGALYMRLYVEAILLDAASHGSPGLDEIRWLRPVRPGDLLHATFSVLETRPSSRRPDRGSVRFAGAMTRDDQPVMTMLGTGLFGRRPA
ncbi:MAG: MaoC family dehydratase [Actinomycetota bacterium]|nr:MaoC family dehydratase [Actinomycetota bacterium]